MSFSITAERGRPAALGATIDADGVHFAVVSHNADAIALCLFEPGEEHESRRLPLPGRDGGVFFGFVPGLCEGARYGLRASGPYQPARGHRFDPAKLLVDPYALRLDRPFRFHPALCRSPDAAVDTAPLVPRAVVSRLRGDGAPLPFSAPGLTYEVLVRGFSMHHPEVPATLRGTLGALREPAMLDYLERIGVQTVELMPLAAWIDERHLPPLGLANSWGYNPIGHMALDPRLAPNGLVDLRGVVDTLHARGIRVVLDVVLNHSGESDEFGPTLCYRGLDNALYYRLREDDPARYANDTGTGNMFAAEREPVVDLFIDTLRTLVRETGVDGFRYDLAPVLARSSEGFSPNAPFLRRLAGDPVLKDRIHIAESWDIGPNGYQVGRFPPPFFEWHDRFRDDVRRFWKGEPGTVPAIATRLAGSPDLFGPSGRKASASVNFVAAHDGFTLADLTMYAAKHNEANGEDNRDGHEQNHSWNNGVEGPTDDPGIIAARGQDIRALLATLFLARGTPLLVAGDEFGRTQGGNNNAYAQDNETIWLDWAAADPALIDLTARLSRLRRDEPALSDDAFLTKDGTGDPVEWLGESGTILSPQDWSDPERRFLGARLLSGRNRRLLFYLNAGREDRSVQLPPPQDGARYRIEIQSDWPQLPPRPIDARHELVVMARSVFVLTESADI